MTTERTPQDVLREALIKIRDLCDTDRDELIDKHGSLQRVLFAVIPGIVDKAIAEAPDSPPDLVPRPAPNVPECTCDRDDDSWVGEGPLPLCSYHEKRLRHLSWESLACMVIDYEAALAAPDTLSEKPGLALALKRLADSAEAQLDLLGPPSIRARRNSELQHALNMARAILSGSTDSEGR